MGWDWKESDINPKPQSGGCLEQKNRLERFWCNTMNGEGGLCLVERKRSLCIWSQSRDLWDALCITLKFWKLRTSSKNIDTFWQLWRGNLSRKTQDNLDWFNSFGYKVGIWVWWNGEDLQGSIGEEGSGKEQSKERVQKERKPKVVCSSLGVQMTMPLPFQQRSKQIWSWSHIWQPFYIFVSTPCAHHPLISPWVSSNTERSWRTFGFGSLEWYQPNDNPIKFDLIHQWLLSFYESMWLLINQNIIWLSHDASCIFHICWLRKIYNERSC